MTIAHDLEALCDWLRRRPEPATELAKAAGLSRNALRRLKAGAQVSLRLDTIAKLEALRARLIANPHALQSDMSPRAKSSNPPPKPFESE